MQQEKESVSYGAQEADSAAVLAQEYPRHHDECRVEEALPPTGDGQMAAKDANLGGHQLESIYTEMRPPTWGAASRATVGKEANLADCCEL